MQSRGIHYWALGGRHERGTPLGGPQVIHYCGSPQGRTPDQPGVHGCTLVQVDAQNQARTVLIPTDAARWLAERITVEPATTREELEGRLRGRVESLLEQASVSPSGEAADAQAESGPAALLISWTIAGRGALFAQLRRDGLAAELLERLRGDYASRRPAVWSASMEVELSETLPPEWDEQETIRGDVLRAVRQLQMNPAEPIGLEAYLSESHRAGSLGALADLPAGAIRDLALREAAALGVDLLSGEEPPE